MSVMLISSPRTNYLRLFLVVMIYGKGLYVHHVALREFNKDEATFLSRFRDFFFIQKLLHLGVFLERST